jgi:hypothetical protein
MYCLVNQMIVVHKPIPGLKPQPAFKIIGIQQESTDKHRIANEENPAIANNREIHPKNAQEKKTSNEFSFPPAHTAVKDVSLKETTQITSPPGQLNLQREKNQDSFSLENHQKKEKSKPIVPVDPFPRSNTISELSDHSLHQKFYTPSIPISSKLAITQSQRPRRTNLMKMTIGTLTLISINNSQLLP